MTLTPWRYFEEGGAHEESGGRAMHAAAAEAHRVLETVIGAVPASSQAQPLLALHMMVHITEADRPAASRSLRGASRGEEAADRLATSAPGLCHLVHMAAHTFVRIGRYADAVRVGLEAMACDAAYVERCLEPYGPGHNVGLMQFPAMMSGMAELAVSHALPLAALPELSFLPTGFYVRPRSPAPRRAAPRARDDRRADPATAGAADPRAARTGPARSPSRTCSSRRASGASAR